MRPALLAGVLCLVALPAAGQTRHRLTDRGLDSLRQEVAVDSVDAQAWYQLGLGLWETHKFDQADSAFQRALHFQPWHAGSHLALAILPGTRGDRYLTDLGHRLGADSMLKFVWSAIGHGAEAMALDPRLDLAPLGFLKDEDLVANTTTYNFVDNRLASIYSPPVRAMRRAMRALIDQQLDSAFAILATALRERRPDQTMNDQFITLYAMAALRSGHPDEAASAYRELAQRAGRREAAQRGSAHVDLGPIANFRGRQLLLYGIAEVEAGQKEVARAAFHEALITDLTFYQAHARLADLAEQDGDLEGALAERRAAIAVSPESARPYLDLGITLLQSGRAGEAEDALTDAAQRLPWDPGIQLFLFQAAMSVGDRSAAQRALAQLDLFAPRRNHDQVVEAHQRFDGSAPP